MRLERAIAVLVLALVLCAALAVSHVDAFDLTLTHSLRWIALVGLTAVAVAYGARGLDRSVRPDRVALLTIALLVLVLGSAFWSANVPLTLGRALSLVLLFVAAGAVAFGIGDAERVTRYILFALLTAGAIVAVGGGLDLLIESDRALIPATTVSPARYNGLGANPNMMAMLLALCLPVAAWGFLAARSTLGKVSAVVAFVVFDASLIASGSRGALLAATAGLVALALALPHRQAVRATLALSAIGLLVVNLALTQIPQPADHNPAPNPELGSQLPLGAQDAQVILPLENELGFPGFGAEGERRSLLGTSGRASAWAGALGQVLERPALGYGFGTEDRVFVDRYYPFYSSRVENSYLGTALQVGFLGVAVLVGLLVALGACGVRALSASRGRRRSAVAACLGVVAAGVVLALTQSYLTSVGNPATAPFWLCAFLLAGLAASSAARDESAVSETAAQPRPPARGEREQERGRPEAPEHA